MIDSVLIVSFIDFVVLTDAYIGWLHFLT